MDDELHTTILDLTLHQGHGVFSKRDGLPDGVEDYLWEVRLLRGIKHCQDSYLGHIYHNLARYSCRHHHCRTFHGIGLGGVAGDGYYSLGWDQI